jgi:hypothetical protein
MVTLIMPVLLPENLPNGEPSPRIDWAHPATAAMGARPSTVTERNNYFERRAIPAICRVFHVAATVD